MGVFAGVAAAGLVTGGVGTFLSAREAGKKRDELRSYLEKYLPDINADTQGYFADLEKYLPQAEKISREGAQSDMATLLGLQEQAIPGFGKAREEAGAALFPLLKGELPKSVTDAFRRSGGASTVGAGWGGSDVGFLNQALFGAKGQLGAMELGYGLLPSLLGTIPQVNAPSTASYLANIMTPAQRTQTQLNVRQQNLGIAQGLAGMPTGNEVWGNWMSSTGGTLLGAGLKGGMASGG